MCDMAFAAGPPTITAGTASGKPGETVSIPLSISNNSGIIALYCSINYDDTQLKLTRVTNGSVLTDPAHSGALTSNPYRLCFDMSLSSSNNINNGVFATLEFEILPAAEPGGKAISISYNPNEIYDFAQKNVFFELLNGKITVLSEDADASQANNSTEPSNNTTGTWDKIVIDDAVAKEKNITTGKVGEGMIVRGDDLHDVSMTIQNGTKYAVIEIDTDRTEVLFKEEGGKVQGYIDADGDGTFELPIIAAEFVTAGSSSNTGVYIIIGAGVVLILAGVVICWRGSYFCYRRNTSKQGNCGVNDDYCSDS
jgi:hypothetical protein